MTAAQPAPDPQEPSKEVVRTPTEDWLAKQTGVEIADLPDGRRMISLPAELEKRCILLTPISQVVQVDKNYSPIPRVVQIDLKRDVYKVGRVKVGPGRDDWDNQMALTSRALAMIAERAAIEHVQTRRVHFPGGMETIVTAMHRGADGLPVYTTRSKVTNWEQRAERVKLDAIEKVRKNNADKNRNDPDPDEFELRKLVVHDREFLAEKDETKAFSRCVRAITGAAAYPQRQLNDRNGRFLVMTYAFTPDYSDPNIKALLDVNYGRATAELYEGEGRAERMLEAPREEVLPGRDVAEFAARQPETDGDDDDGIPDEDEVPREVETVSGEVDEGDAGEPGADEPPPEDVDAELLWDDGPSKPDEGVTFKAGPFKDREIEEVAQFAEGQRWLALQARRQRTPERRQKMLDWLSWGVGKVLTFEDLDDIATTE